MWTPDVFGAERALIGMVHLRALPGTPCHDLPLDRIVEIAVAEAQLYRKTGFDAVILENMHDRPYMPGAVGPEIVACATAAAREVRRVTGLPMGIQLLAGANREALAVALASGAEFVRAEAFVFAHVADEGILQACAGELTRYRRQIGADRIRILADVKKKHAAHALTADVDLAETVRAAEFFLADGVIVTGASTGCTTDAQEVAHAAAASRLPVFVGSGVTPENLSAYPAAAGLIVGSCVKAGGLWSGDLDPERCRAVARAFRG